MRADSPFATATWYQVMSFDITQCHSQNCPISVPAAADVTGRSERLCGGLLPRRGEPASGGIGAGRDDGRERTRMEVSFRRAGGPTGSEGDATKGWTIFAYIVKWSEPIYDMS